MSQHGPVAVTSVADKAPPPDPAPGDGKQRALSKEEDL
jgi:hypothetical protein